MDFLAAQQIECPHCGEIITIEIDTSQGDHSTIEDCTVCCSPIDLDIRCTPGEPPVVEASAA